MGIPTMTEKLLKKIRFFVCISYFFYQTVPNLLQWKTNLVSLSRSALGQTLMVNQLVDMEWKFGGTAVRLLNVLPTTFLKSL